MGVGLSIKGRACQANGPGTAWRVGRNPRDDGRAAGGAGGILAFRSTSGTAVRVRSPTRSTLSAARAATGRPRIPPSHLHGRSPDKRSLFERVVEFLSPGPDSRDELIETLADAEDNDVIGAESRVMLEGVLRMADMTAGDVMVAAPRMDLVNIDAPYDALLHLVIDTAPLALSGLRGREGKHHRHPAREGPAQAAARAGAEHPRAAAAADLRARDPRA